MILHIAAYDWDHAEWSGNFYPEDMPTEWRLSYYANEFRAVVVPTAQWLHLSVEELAVWCRETGPLMRLFLEMPADATVIPSESQSRANRGLGENFAGFVPHLSEWTDAGMDGNMGLGLYTAPASNPALLRKTIEKLAAAPGNQGLLLFTGRPPCVAAMRAAGVIATLMGI